MTVKEFRVRAQRDEARDDATAPATTSRRALYTQAARANAVQASAAQQAGAARGAQLEATATIDDAKAMVIDDSATDAAAEARENRFWRGLSGEMEPPLYGADLPGSLFEESDLACGWSIRRLPSPLRLLDNALPGVSTSMLYVGMRRAMFAFHVEDMNLYSINLLHLGQPKSW